jgi:hypothetical protein
MKKLCFLTTILVILVLCTNVLQAQTTKPQLSQIELMKQFLGTYQANVGKDTTEVWESQLYGNGVIINVSQVIKGKKSPLYVNNTGFNADEGKLIGFILNQNATYTTWTGQFTDDKNFSGMLMNNFKPEQAWGKFAFVFINPQEWTLVTHDMNGVKTTDLKYTKVK